MPDTAIEVLLDLPEDKVPSLAEVEDAVEATLQRLEMLTALRGALLEADHRRVRALLRKARAEKLAAG